jgi:hypothetical protein
VARYGVSARGVHPNWTASTYPEERMATGDAAPYDLRVKSYVPRVKDFERDEKGNVILESLKGPARIEVRVRDSQDGMHLRC